MIGRMRRGLYRPGAVLFAAAFATAYAGPPFVTDDPAPVEPHHWEINTAATASWRHAQSSIGLPSVDINYGAAPDLQFHAQPRYAIERDRVTEMGIDDTEIGIKYRFYLRKSGDASFMLGIYPMYQLATGARRLGADRGTRDVFLPLWAQYDRGAWTVYGGAGYRLNRGDGGRNSIFSGVTILRQVWEGLQLGVETFHETRAANDEGSTRGFNVGGAQVLSDRLNLLFSAGRSFGSAPANQAYVGLQVHF
jgi:hypothetical protein